MAISASATNVRAKTGKMELMIFLNMILTSNRICIFVITIDGLAYELDRLYNQIPDPAVLRLRRLEVKGQCQPPSDAE